MKFDHLDDPSPPDGNADFVAELGRRYRRRQRAGVAGTAAVVALALVAGIAVVADDGGVRVEPAETTAAIDDRPATATWSDNGLEFGLELAHAQAVVDGPVTATLTVENPTDAPIDLAMACAQRAPGLLGTVSNGGVPSNDVLPTPTIGACLEPPIEIAARAVREFALETTVEGPGLGVQRAFFFDANLEVQGSVEFEVVAPSVRFEMVPSDTTLGSGQIIDVELVAHNDTEALIPFPGPGSVCPVGFQVQIVAAGAEPTPFAWPGVIDCDEAQRLLNPGRNSVATIEVDVPDVGPDAELVGAIDYAWPPGFTPPPRIPASVQTSEGPRLTMSWSVEPSEPVSVAPGGVATFELVVRRVEGNGGFERDFCPSRWVLVEGDTPLPEIAYTSVRCHLSAPDVAVGDRFPFEVRATWGDAEGNETPLPPGTYQTTLPFGQAITIVVVAPG